MVSAESAGLATVCREPGCDLRAVVTASLCRNHLLESLRREGEAIPFDDPDLAGLCAVANQVMRFAIALPPSRPQRSDDAGQIDMYVMLDPDSEWQIAQIGLDFLGTHCSDLFGQMVLSPPMGYESKMLLRLRISVPSVEGYEPRMDIALEAMMREVLGPDVPFRSAVAPAE